MVGSEHPLQIFLKGIFVQEGSSGTCFDQGQFKIKTFPIYALPYCVDTIWILKVRINLDLHCCVGSPNVFEALNGCRRH